MNILNMDVDKVVSGQHKTDFTGVDRDAKKGNGVNSRGYCCEIGVCLDEKTTMRLHLKE